MGVVTAGYSLDSREHQPLVDAIVIGKHLATRFVERRVRADEAAFVEAWEQRGGKRDGRLITWLEREPRERSFKRSQASTRSSGLRDQLCRIGAVLFVVGVRPPTRGGAKGKEPRS